MKIKELLEISRIQGGAQNDASKFQHKFKNSKHSPGILGLSFSETMDEYDSIFLGLFDNTELISCIQLDYRDFPYIQLTSTVTNIEWRRKGCFRFLMNAAIKKYTHVLSDDSQTSSAEEAWKGLIDNPGLLKIDMFDTNTLQFQKLELNKIWNHNYAFLLHATM